MAILALLIFHFTDFEKARGRFFYFAGAADMSEDTNLKLMGSLGYLAQFLAGQVPDYVVFGRRNPLLNLFNRAEASIANPRRDKLLRETGLAISAFIADLATMGVTAVVVAVPFKMMIEPESLDGPPRPAGLWDSRSVLPEGEPTRENSERNFHALIDPAHSHIVDLYEVYRRYHRAFPNELLFIPWDYHWTSLGSALAAVATIQKLNGLGYRFPAATLHFDSRKHKPHDAHLLTQLQLPEFYVNSRPELDWFEPLYTLSASSAHRATPCRLVIAGNSFAARHQASRFGFGPLLAHATGCRLFDFSKVGGEYLGSFQAMRDTHFTFRTGDILVWQISSWGQKDLYRDIPCLTSETGRSARCGAVAR